MKNWTALTEMLASQDKLNSMLAEDWKTKDWDHRTALFCEIGEVIEELQYKWWKAPKAIDTAALRSELVDCWHFALNIMLVENSAPDILTLTEAIENSYLYTVDEPSQSYPQYLRAWERDLVKHLDFFLSACLYADMDFPELYKEYTIKNTLNIFRWNNGYRTGEYVNAYMFTYQDETYCLTDEDSRVAQMLAEELGEELKRDTLYAALEQAHLELRG